MQGYQTADEFSPEKDKTEPLNGSNENGSDSSSVAFSQSCGNSFDKTNSKSPGPASDVHKDFQENVDKLKNNLRTNVPDCQCFPPDKCKYDLTFFTYSGFDTFVNGMNFPGPPEPGSYYTHLGAAASLSDLRKDLESRTGQTGKALRFEKICYTGKEGKTTQGCPLAKWVR